MIRSCIFLFGIVCIGCNSTHPASNVSPTEYRLDHVFLNTSHHIESEEEIFALSPEMQTYVQQNLMTINDPFKRAERLLQDLFTPEKLALAYDSGADLIAQDTFQTQLANCLSLTIMTYALTDYANISSQFRHVNVEENWAQRYQQFVANGHVNLRIIGEKFDNRKIYSSNHTVIDFVPSLAKLRSSPLTKQQVVAMFYGNKGADAMLRNDYDTAYRYFVAGLNLNASDSSLWHNLGILYKRSGYLALSETLYHHSLSIKPDDNNVLESLAILYEITDRENEANGLRRKIQASRKTNPFYFAMLGDQAYQDMKYSQAIRHYRRSLSLNPKQSNVLFGIAKSYYQMHEFDTASAYMKRAAQASELIMERRQYQQKLETLAHYAAKLNSH